MKFPPLVGDALPFPPATTIAGHLPLEQWLDSLYLILESGQFTTALALIEKIESNWPSAWTERWPVLQFNKVIALHRNGRSGLASETAKNLLRHGLQTRPDVNTPIFCRAAVYVALELAGRGDRDAPPSRDFAAQLIEHAQDTAARFALEKGAWQSSRVLSDHAPAPLPSWLFDDDPLHGLLVVAQAHSRWLQSGGIEQGLALAHFFAIEGALTAPHGRAVVAVLRDMIELKLLVEIGSRSKDATNSTLAQRLYAGVQRLEHAPMAGLLAISDALLEHWEARARFSPTHQWVSAAAGLALGMGLIGLPHGELLRWRLHRQLSAMLQSAPSGHDASAHSRNGVRQELLRLVTAMGSPIDAPVAGLPLLEAIEDRDPAQVFRAIAAVDIDERSGELLLRVAQARQWHQVVALLYNRLARLEEQAGNSDSAQELYRESFSEALQRFAMPAASLNIGEHSPAEALMRDAIRFELRRGHTGSARIYTDQMRLARLPGCAPAHSHDFTEAVRKRLPPDCALISYFLDGTKVWIDAITPQGEVTRSRALPPSFWEKIDAFKGEPSRARELYHLLIAPVAEVLPPYRHLGLIPDGALWNLAFEDLMWDERLVEQHHIFYMPALQAAVLPPQQFVHIGLKPEELASISGPTRALLQHLRLGRCTAWLDPLVLDDVVPEDYFASRAAFAENRRLSLYGWPFPA